MAFFPRRWPIVPTVLVAAVALGMAGLGVWQLQRHDQKRAAIALIRANLDKPAVAYPKLGPVPPEMLFRRSATQCLRVESWSTDAGKAADGSTGFRLIAHCSTGAEGPGTLIEAGIAARPDLKPRWNGGQVSGWIVEEPDHRSLLGHLTGPKVTLRPMLIADVALDPALKAAAPPQIASIPNNHLGYALQWFAFAIIALLIYGIALSRRQSAQDRDS
ncbi:MAG: SURF1 family protein [Sphingobium sp.]